MNELVAVCVVFMSLFVLSFGFRFGFPGVLIFMPVHLAQRKAHLEPATTSRFFSSPSVMLLKLHPPC
jgi:hypothetical protein